MPKQIHAALGLLLAACSSGEPTTPPTDPVSAVSPPQEARPARARPDPSEDWHVLAGGGRFYRDRVGASQLSTAQLREIESLRSIGYLDGQHPAERQGVVRHDEERAFSSLNLVTSAHGPVAYLMDMQGRPLHQWEYPFLKAFPGEPERAAQAGYWRRTHLAPNGDLTAIYEGQGIVRVDRDSKLRWKSLVRVHHDLEVLEDGSVWVLTREANLVPSIDAEKPILEDFVSLLNPEGKEVRRISLVAALDRSPWKPDWAALLESSGDVLHTNTIRLLDGSHAGAIPAFRRGRLLLSMLMLDMIAVFDPETESFVWAHRGGFSKQHDPRLLPNGNLLLFDNGDASRRSSIQEIDPASGEVIWSYRGRAEEPFFSASCGDVERLGNGNTLVTESDYGRAFEIAPDGQIVWEYFVPHRAGSNREFIATLMEVSRLPRDFPLDWLEDAGTR